MTNSNSPIEDLFETALVRLWNGEFRKPLSVHATMPGRLTEGPHLLRQVPFRAGRYRADFAFALAVPEFVSFVVIECDGHEFHERTKLQATRDRQRDRWFARRGLHLIRFTGMEIYADATTCASESIGHLATVFGDDSVKCNKDIGSGTN